MKKPLTQTLGYPCIGRNRELKRALESYWKNQSSEEDLLETFRLVQEENWRTQLEAGVDLIGIGDATLYDRVLDWAVRFGLIPPRFQGLEGLNRYFAMARGTSGKPALDLTKWFDTNYHYLVPELAAELQPEMHFADFLQTVKRAQSVLGERAVPIILGPITLLQLSRMSEGWDKTLATLIPLYRHLLEDLRSLGVIEAQLHEPILVLSEANGLKSQYQTAYAALAESNLPINLVTYFDDLGDTYSWVVELPVSVLTLDFTRGRNLECVTVSGWPEEKTLAAGVVDGRSVWRVWPTAVLPLLRQIESFAPVRISASSSLQFVPYQVAHETNLPDALREVLAFAEEKVQELVLMARWMRDEEIEELQELETSWQRFRAFAPPDPRLGKRLERLSSEDFRRSKNYRQRRQSQIQLPLLPTTTIGSFPQTKEVRLLRARFKRGEISQLEYESEIHESIVDAVGTQEDIGLDVLVHGEFERSDMVEYFAQKMSGFAFTENGWVQSYGNRYVRPPIIYTDVRHTQPMTLREYRIAQSLTTKPVKGMLTGPVTILEWSYPRSDVSRKDAAFQIALALRTEISELEKAGARIIQVDEPALREGLPLKRERCEEYLSWAVDAFRLATAGAAPEVQIHTHMCYAEFGDIFQAIDQMDADVISIENARSGDETVRELAGYRYQREIGPGVYDVHSPAVPSVDAILEKLRTFLKFLRPEQIWVNPDCGLKTRGWHEVKPALNNIVHAIQLLRAEIHGSGSSYSPRT